MNYNFRLLLVLMGLISVAIGAETEASSTVEAEISNKLELQAGEASKMAAFEALDSS